MKALITSYIPNLWRFEVCSLNWTKQCFASLLTELSFSIMSWVWFTYCLAPIGPTHLIGTWEYQTKNFAWKITQAVLRLHGSPTTWFILVFSFVHLVLNHFSAYTVFCSKNSIPVIYAMLFRVSMAVFTRVVMICELLSCPDNKVVPAWLFRLPCCLSAGFLLSMTEDGANGRTISHLLSLPK